MASRQESTARQDYPIIDRVTTREIVDLLDQKGWEIREGDPKRLVPVEKGCTVHCFDGRPATDGTNPTLLRGIRIPGGVYGVAALSSRIHRGIAQGNLLFQACDVTKDAGFVPVAHGDDGHGARGCGFVNLWLEERFDGLGALPMSPEYAEKLAEHSQRLLYLKLKGGHREQAMDIVLKQGMTRIPDGETFQITPWAGPLLGADPFAVVFSAMHTVEMLGGARSAVLYE